MGQSPFDVLGFGRVRLFTPAVAAEAPDVPGAFVLYTDKGREVDFIGPTKEATIRSELMRMAPSVGTERLKGVDCCSWLRANHDLPLSSVELADAMLEYHKATRGLPPRGNWSSY